MTRAEQFQQLRPLLFAVADRILGSVSEAEDAVQEAWLRYQAAPTPPTSAKAFLSAVVTRISIEVLRSARVRREAYVGPWFPEPLLGDPYQDPARSAELADSVSMAALVLLERLSPPERAVLVLGEVLGFSFPEVASAVGRSAAACRQLAVRARRHMAAGRPRFQPLAGEVLIECAWAAARSRDTCLAAQYWRLARRIGKKKAAVAVGHSILVIAWYLLTDECDYQALVATTSSGATPTASGNGPLPSSRPSATTSSWNPSPRNTQRIHVSG